MSFGNVEQNFAVSQTKLFEVALKWWESKRPCEFSLLDHLQNPEVNTTTKTQSDLAKEVAFILRNEVME